jgi:hypothetical protein
MRSETRWERMDDEAKVREKGMVDLVENTEVRDRSLEVCIVAGNRGGLLLVVKMEERSRKEMEEDINTAVG